MDDLEQKLSSILGNPEMMAQLMHMAQSFSSGEASGDSTKEQNSPAAMPQESAAQELQTIQRIVGLAQKASIDQEQRQLLKALRPYLSAERITKLEKAMRAAKIAGIATTFLENNRSQLNFGR